jgi:hypothetical protein
MSDTVDDVMNSIQESEPEDVVVEESTVVSGDAPVETPEEETPEEASEEEAPVEEAQEEKPMEQVVSDIRDILSEGPVATSEEAVSTDNLCSLKTLIDVLGKWSGNEIGRRQVEELLKEGSEVDENLDDLEKMVEVLQLWIGEGGSTFRDHNHFKNLDEYTLVGESRNLSEEKKVEVLKIVTDLVVTVSQRRVKNEEIQNVMDSLY